MRTLRERILSYENSHPGEFSDEEKDLAWRRLQHCEGCEHVSSTFDKELDVELQFCSLCGCMLAKKLHDPEESCSAGKWGEEVLETETFSKPKITRFL